MRVESKLCETCGQPFYKTGGRPLSKRRFCSNKCCRPDWGKTISEGLKARWAAPGVPTPCPVCGETFQKRVSTQKHCGSNKCKYGTHKTSDPIRAKAVTLSSPVKLGVGRTAFIEGILRAALDRPCHYCSDIVTLSNASLDHIIPFGGLRGKPMAKALLDTRENLRIICRRCNRGKGNLSDRGFRKLLEFLRSDPEISTYVWRRIAGGGVQFMAWRHNSRKRR